MGLNAFIKIFMPKNKIFYELFEKVANEVNNLNPNVLSNYQRTSGGYEGYAKTFRNGQQVWVQTFNGKIINAGVNIVPK